MRYYPIHLDIHDTPCLLVGAGQVGLRKARLLVDCGARLSVVSPQADDAFHQWHRRGVLDLTLRTFLPQDVNGQRLVIAATDNADVNRRVCECARSQNIWCNAIQAPDQGDMVLPSVVNRPGLTLTISTHGKSPALARHLRQKLEGDIGPEYDLLANILGRMRARNASSAAGPDYRDQFQKLLSGNVLDLLRQGNFPAVRQLLTEVCGAAHGFDDWDLLTEKG